MAGEIQLNSTTMATESSNTITLSNVNSATNRTNLGLGSIATQNANAVALTGGSLTGTEIDLKSSGTTIFKSDGTTAVLSESGGVVTFDNVTLAGDVSMASSGLTLRNVELFPLASDQTATSTTLTTFFSQNYTPKFAGSKVQGVLHLVGQAANNSSYDARTPFQMVVSGSGITDVSTTLVNIGTYDYGGSGAILGWNFDTSTPLVTTTTTDVITFEFKLRVQSLGGNPSWAVNGNNTMEETFLTVFEYK
jgi:hypothetical protein